MRLWKTLNVIRRKEKVLQQWRFAEGVWIPKEENASNTEQFRTISLLCMECKIFSKIVASRLTEYLLKNNFIDTSVPREVSPAYLAASNTCNPTHQRGTREQG